MASTTLFAPIVGAIQPAFEYDVDEKIGGVKIYFSLSAYNNPDDFSYVAFSIIDANQASTWGSNSKIKSDISPSGLLAMVPSEENGQYCISIDLANTDLFNKFNVNQFYQVQLYLLTQAANSSMTEIETTGIYKVGDIASSFYDDKVSLPSQVTLIRPIPKTENIVLDQLPEEEEINELLEFSELSGHIQYKDHSMIEQISETYFTIKDEEENIVYSSLRTKNFLGTQFKISVPDIILEESEEAYTLTFYFTTINGYTGNTSKSFVISSGSASGSSALYLSKCKVLNDLDGGSIRLELELGQREDSIESSGEIKIQRSDSYHNFLNWRTIFSVQTDNVFERAFIAKDYLIDGKELYRYRLCFIENSKNGPVTHIIDSYSYEDKKGNQITKKIEATADFEDIFISDQSGQLAIRFNPSISQFKWVTQENITNTLGGKFPIIRINGDTFYRQFSISGTLSFLAESFVQDASYDSRGVDISHFLGASGHSLFFNIDEAFANLGSERFNAYKRKPDIIEKKFRTAAMSFLTNQKPKLFRSPTEDIMIIYLSNISFTPNKQLGRNIYDFSATATEVCEFSVANLQRFSLDTYQDFDEYMYILSAIKADYSGGDDGVIYLTPYISGGNVIDGAPIIKQIRTKDLVK